MTETKRGTPRIRAEGAGRKALSDSVKKVRVQLYLNPTLAAFLEAEDLPDGSERSRAARRRKQEAAESLLRANIESRII